ncbi:MAG: DUF5799 family protein [Halanaeroarchaeum sp.]
MSDEPWRDRIVGARMTVDDQFADRIDASSFSRQQWSLIMTATEFEIESAGDPDTARIVANTDALDSIMPELDSVDQQMQALGGGAGSPGKSGGAGSIGSIVDRVRTAFGLGAESSGSDEDRRAEATKLVDEYASALQRHLESTGRWEEVRRTAAEDA